MGKRPIASLTRKNGKTFTKVKGGGQAAAPKAEGATGPDPEEGEDEALPGEADPEPDEPEPDPETDAEEDEPEPDPEDDEPEPDASKPVPGIDADTGEPEQPAPSNVVRIDAKWDYIHERLRQWERYRLPWLMRRDRRGFARHSPVMRRYRTWSEQRRREIFAQADRFSSGTATG
jgi:hypothetical protein